MSTKGSELQEAFFDFDELFFSRTDPRGIILSGNAVFQRVSQFKWNELLNKPHNLIRHYDMPKGVFCIFWDFLKSKKPIGAYVKNKSKDGKYYWVFAIATPIENGYLSVRLKPSSKMFSLIKKAYKSFLDDEKNSELTPKESADKIKQALKDLGFESYERFMSTAIRMEIEARNSKLKKSKDNTMCAFERLTTDIAAISKESNVIQESYHQNQYVPRNLQIQSFRLGDAGNSISIVSKNYNEVSLEIQKDISRLNESASEVFERIYEAQFLLCTTRIQNEVINFFKNEEVEGCIDAENEMALLEMQKNAYEDKAKDSMSKLLYTFKSLLDDCNKIKKSSISLDVIRIMAKMEASSVSEQQSSLGELINDLSTFQESLSVGIKNIEHCNFNIHTEIKRMCA